MTCWGKDTVIAADKTTAEGAREALKKHEKHPDGDIKSFFQRQTQRTGRPTYSDRCHTPAQARLVLLTIQRDIVLTRRRSAQTARWVAEDGRPFSIVSDKGYHSLQKTGRPDYYIPHPTTVSRDVKQIYAITRGGAINKTLQVC